MKSSPTLAAAQHFLDVVWSDPVPTDAALIAALDRLVAIYHDTPEGQVSDFDSEAPQQEGLTLYEEVAERFPDYGIYPVTNRAAEIEDPMMMGDAIDDLTDLTLDMREVIWLADNVSIADAHWAFKLQFFHWGEHARELALYLSDRL